MRRLTLLAALLCLLANCALAEPLAFGGRGEDALYEAVYADGGFFAAGTTASSDGDLDMRTRSGEAGWAMLADRQGEHVWSFSSGKSGMYTMTAPHAYADGMYSVVLTDETRQRGEWIVLSNRGRQESRVAIPKISALCPQGETGEILAMQPAYGSTGPYLTLLLSHAGSGELCCTALFPDGGVRSCGEFFGDAQGVLLPVHSGGAVYVSAELGAIAVTHLGPGIPPETELIALPDEDVGVARVTDALCDGDESLLIALQTVTAGQKSGVQLMRVSASGEILFERLAEDMLSMLTETDTGYAALLGETSVVFFDEDGAQQGQADAPDGTLDLIQAGEGVYALTHDPERGRRQALFTRIAPEEAQAQLLTQVKLATPAVQKSPEPAKVQDSLPLGEGHLRCRGVFGGVIVTRVDAEGDDVWQTRIPIHTAADRLVFESADILPGGDILLDGHYETKLPEGMLREAAQARLSAEGVLKEIATVQ